MAENKTVRTSASVPVFISGIENATRQQECKTLLKMMRQITNLKPAMWGDSIVGFGEYHYKYASGRQGDHFLTGFSPRKSALTIYIMPEFKRYGKLLEKLGKHKHSVSCLYLTQLDKVDPDILEQLIAASVEQMKPLYPDWKK